METVRSSVAMWISLSAYAGSADSVVSGQPTGRARAYRSRETRHSSGGNVRPARRALRDAVQVQKRIGLRELVLAEQSVPPCSRDPGQQQQPDRRPGVVVNGTMVGVKESIQVVTTNARREKASCQHDPVGRPYRRLPQPARAPGHPDPQPGPVRRRHRRRADAHRARQRPARGLRPARRPHPMSAAPRPGAGAR